MKHRSDWLGGCAGLPVTAPLLHFALAPGAKALAGPQYLAGVLAVLAAAPAGLVNSTVGQKRRTPLMAVAAHWDKMTVGQS